MKNQYFGDNRDLFTYDLVWEIIRAGLVSRFTFIPMLTPDDNSRHGQKYNRVKAVGRENKVLMRFLDKCVKNGRRDIQQLKPFFTKQGIETSIYDRSFSHQKRREYFAQIGKGLLAKSLILVDPDIGLEVGQPGEKHVSYAELKDLYRRMDKRSILMVFQYFPRVPRLDYLNRRCAELKEKVNGDWPVCVDDNNIIFFFLTKDESLEHSLTHLIGDYTERYSN